MPILKGLIKTKNIDVAQPYRFSHIDAFHINPGILLTQGPIPEIFAKFFWECQLFWVGHFEKKIMLKKISQSFLGINDRSKVWLLQCM